jgi:protoporphyrinogen oxidase
MAPEHETSLIAEVPCFTGDAIAALPDAELAQREERELAGVGLFEPREVLGWRHHFLANAYPVYARDYGDSVARVLAATDSIANLDLLGRNGRFWYSHLHDQLRAARDYVASLGTRPAHEPFFFLLSLSASALLKKDKDRDQKNRCHLCRTAQ